MNTRYYTLLLVASFATFSTKAQESTHTAGGTASGSGGKVTYSIGQAMFNVNTGTSGSVSEGVQQAYGLNLVTSINEQGIETFTLLVFPNPTVDQVKLQLPDQPLDKMRFELYDIKGELLQKGQITSSLTELSLTNISSGVYLLKVIKQNLVLKTLKVIKQK